MACTPANKYEKQDYSPIKYCESIIYDAFYSKWYDQPSRTTPNVSDNQTEGFQVFAK